MIASLSMSAEKKYLPPISAKIASKNAPPESISSWTSRRLLTMRYDLAAAYILGMGLIMWGWGCFITVPCLGYAIAGLAGLAICGVIIWGRWI